MLVQLAYCGMCGYGRRADALARALEAALGVGVERVEAGQGAFEVHVDGRLVFSKHTSGRFPEEAELLALLLADGAGR
jgi:selenoprotein W-related protein